MSLWSFGRYNLGLSEREFWKLTPAQFYALSQRHKQERELKMLDSASIVAAIYNVNRDPKKRKRPFSPYDFMPKEKVEKSPEELLEQVKILHRMFGGE